MLTKRYTEEALDFIDRNADKPFFLYIPHSMVHVPHHASDEFRGKTGKGIYGDVVAEVDWSTGQIVEKLKELGIEENTLVLFTSDNGGPYHIRNIPGYSSNYPYSGGKTSASEGGFRMPTIVWWPGTITPGSTCDLMVSSIDLLPTFASLSGESFVPAQDRPIDGYDLSSLFRKKLPRSSARSTFIYYTDNTEPGAPRHPRGLSAVREGNWKYYLKPQQFRLAGKEEGTTVPAGALFNLEKDVAETTNVAEDNPKIINRMKALAAEIAGELGDGEKQGTGVRKAGYFEEARPMNLKNRPNILFIALDDMNDWTTLFDPENPIKTPNLKRLASRGCFFSKAYCTTAACNPSRTAILTGMHATSTGIYANNNAWSEVLPDVVTLPQHFMNYGYSSRGGGKIFHHGRTGNDRPDNPSFQEFFKLQIHANAPEKNYNGYTQDMPGVRGLARNSWDWGVHDVEKHTDEYTVEYIENVMEREWKGEMKQPMFLAAGVFRPHLPFWAPPRSFEQYPLNELVLPPMPPDDLDDVGEIAKQMAHTEYFIYSNVTKQPAQHPGSLESMVQSYQASATFSDEMVGRLLDKLEETGKMDNTIIVLWSDHGYHLGDKEACVKFTLWEKANHVPFIIVAPGITTPGSRCDAPVSLLDIYPTLADLAGLPPNETNDGQSLLPLLENPEAEWERPALMTMGRGNHAIRSRDWRYIRYSDGTEELYDQINDPWNHTNLALDPVYADVIAKHKKWLPKEEVEKQ
ncbi:hypothetical protein ES705_32035 [subsurface metagenome]